MTDLIWTTADGTQIAVEDMTEAHAKNCLRVLMRRNSLQNNIAALPSMIDDDLICSPGHDQYGSLD